MRRQSRRSTGDGVSIHAARAGSDPMRQLFSVSSRIRFQSTRPARAATALSSRLRAPQIGANVSIHAARAGG